MPDDVGRELSNFVLVAFACTVLALLIGGATNTTAWILLAIVWAGVGAAIVSTTRKSSP
jgi:hypothetical protein